MDRKFCSFTLENIFGGGGGGGEHLPTRKTFSLGNVTGA